jgi:hypothetical protein
MKLSRQIRPISYRKAHAAEIVRNLAEQQEPMIISKTLSPICPNSRSGGLTLKNYWR